MEERKMDRVGGYKVVCSFDCGDVNMVVVKAAYGTHVMPCNEWELIKHGLPKSGAEFHTNRENIKVA